MITTDKTSCIIQFEQQPQQHPEENQQLQQNIIINTAGIEVEDDGLEEEDDDNEDEEDEDEEVLEGIGNGSTSQQSLKDD